MDDAQDKVEQLLGILARLKVAVPVNLSDGSGCKQSSPDGPRMPDHEADPIANGSSRQYANLVANGQTTDDTLGLEHEHEHEHAHERLPSRHQLVSQVTQFEQIDHVLADCESQLDNTRSVLELYLHHLSRLTQDISELQQRSNDMTVAAKNRQNLEMHLTLVLEQLVLPPELVDILANSSDISPSWIRALHDLDRRSALFYKSKYARTKAFMDVGEQMENLKILAGTSIRDTVVDAIKAMRVVDVDVPSVRRKRLLPIRYTLSFIAKHFPTLTADIVQAYVNTLHWYHTSQSERLRKVLEQHRKPPLRWLGLGNLEAASKFFSFSTGSGAVPSSTDYPFQIGTRTRTLEICKQKISTIDNTLSIEEIFRIYVLTLMDSVSDEYLFFNNLFEEAYRFGIQQQIFGDSFTIGNLLLSNGEQDLFGILICIRILQIYALELQQRRVPVMDGFIDGLNMTFWQEFQNLIDLHCESLQKAHTGIESSVLPHPATQRYADLVYGILALSADDHEDEPLIQSLLRLRTGIQNFLKKTSSTQSKAKDKSRFLYNNYSLIAAILSASLQTENRTIFLVYCQIIQKTIDRTIHFLNMAVNKLTIG